MSDGKEKNKHPKRIVVQRTATVEAQLQKLWRLSPEYKEKISMTVSAALAALIREAETVSPTDLSVFNPDSEWN